MNPITFNELVGNEYIFSSKIPLYAIYNDEKVVAYLSGYNHSSELEIKMIEVLSKEQGTGTSIINWLFESLPIERIIGRILKEERSYYFWDSLGAEIDLVEEGYTIDEIVREGLESAFMLYSPTAH